MSLTIIKGRPNSIKSKRYELKSIEDCLNFYNTEKKYTDVNKFINFPDLLISELNYAIEHDTVFQYKNFIKKFIPSFLKPNAKFPIQLDFWINRGYSLNDAHSKISNIQSNFSKKFVEKRKNNPTQYLGISPNQIEYWTARGLSIDEAKLEVSNRQKTFSLSKCIQKYGKVQGLEKFNERQKKWQNSLNVSKDITWKTSQRSLSFAQYEKRYGKMWISVYVEHLNNKSKNIKYINDLIKIHSIVIANSDILEYLKSLNSSDIFRFARNRIIMYLTKKTYFELISEWMESNQISSIKTAGYGTKYYINGKYYQSTAEFILGTKLTELKIDFEVHKRYPGTRYYSDFYIPKISTYIEYMGMPNIKYNNKKYELSKSEFSIIWSNQIDKIIDLIYEEIHKNN